MSGVLQAVKNTFDDSKFIVYDHDDDTSRIAFDISPVATGTTRTITWPDRDFDFTNPVFDGNVTIGSSVSDTLTINAEINQHLVYSDAFIIKANTADGADTSYIDICGGGLNSVLRGAFVELLGNEYTDSSYRGDVGIYAGNAATSGHISFFTGASVERLKINYDGSIDLGTNKIGNDGSAGGLSFSAAHLATFSHAVTVTGLLTASGNIVIPDAGYIGSASDVDAIQIEADGDVVLTQDLSIAGSLAVQGGGVLAAGDGYVDASTARASPTSIAGRHVITIAPSDAIYFALADKVDGQMVVVQNAGDVAAYVDDDETENIYIPTGNSFVGFWDSTTDKWYGVVGTSPGLVF